jgi:serine O-acetyltransferase
MIFSDLKFYFRQHGFFTSIFNLGLWSLLLYRLGYLMHGKSVFKFFLLWYLFLFFKNLLILFSKIELPPTSKIGSRLDLVHAYGLVMGDKVIIGDDVIIGPWVVIGHNGNANSQPIISNKVYIGSKATILGGISIGENAFIGPNTVLTKSLAPGQIAKVAFCIIN